jgi:hypothetical protein
VRTAAGWRGDLWETPLRGKEWLAGKWREPVGGHLHEPDDHRQSITARPKARFSLHFARNESLSFDR